ncbi:MAG: hypothetical protein HYY55_03360 [Candidatus Niyogibacteria bacterium]|nr:MAG: hypothetical protein HYY55_03360 [Candidatus Niyogibacteria bacterium]
MNKGALKTIIILFLLNALAIFGWWLFYRRLDDAGGRIGVLREEIFAADAKQKNIKLLEETLQSIGDDRSKIEDVFVDEKSVVGFIENLEKVAADAGASLEISSVSLQAKVEDGGPSFNLNLEGSFGRLLKFLTLLENINYQVKIGTARFSVLNSGIWDLQVKLNLLSYKF